jgi:hypothetical protein
LEGHIFKVTKGTNELLTITNSGELRLFGNLTAKTISTLPIKQYDENIRFIKVVYAKKTSFKE